ncbi:hemerythrin-like domain-containing protein [Rhodovulum iodosum]|uniref:Hemerythrin-like domain-containing protein n=1 Tax=Rhodovulum iodosum TaxID=68291 RepID=A0ABV3XSB2_9RHOB|nr:NepR family anti-sigma factor [Rhodovulum robiginosum]
MEEQIDANLRRVYADTVQEEVPERFLKLLDELREKGKAVPDSEADS